MTSWPNLSLVLLLTLSCALCVICGFIKSVQLKLITLLRRNFVCHKCSGEIVPATVAYVKEINVRNDNFPVKFTIRYLGYMIGQCGSCSYAVSTCTVSWYKAFQEFLPILTNQAVQTKPRRNVCNMCVSKVLLYSNKTWSVVTEDVWQLGTAESGMIRWICGVSWKNHIPVTDLLLGPCFSSINELELTEVPWALVTYRWWCMSTKATMHYIDGRQPRGLPRKWSRGIKTKKFIQHAGVLLPAHVDSEC